MAFIPVEDAAEAVVTYHVGAITFQNVFGYNITPPLTSVAAAHIASVLVDAYSELLGAQKTTVEYDSCVVTDVSSITGPQFSPSFVVGPGTDTAELLPYQSAALISWSTDTRGRSYRGRTYLTGFCEDHSSGRDLSTDLKNALGEFADLIVGDGDFCVLSRYELNPTPPPSSIPRTLGIATPITGSTVHPLWRTQRRRATR